jgi:hypothetical protein
METLKKRLEEQQKRHQGGNKWIGTGGTSRSAMAATTPKACASAARASTARDQGLGKARVPEPRQHARAWHAQHQGRAAPPAPLRARRRGRGAGSRRHHRRHRAAGLARHPHAARTAQCGQGAAVPRCRRIDGPVHQAGRGAVQRRHAEFKNLEFFYFHNCLYEGVWKDNRRRWSERTRPGTCSTSTGHDYKVIFVGDAAMSPYEISHPGGSVEHFNDEAGRGLDAARVRIPIRRRSGSTPRPSGSGNIPVDQDHPGTAGRMPRCIR